MTRRDTSGDEMERVLREGDSRVTSQGSILQVTMPANAWADLQKTIEEMGEFLQRIEDQYRLPKYVVTEARDMRIRSSNLIRKLKQVPSAHPRPLLSPIREIREDRDPRRGPK